MKILPELEAYRDRLMARAAAWSETPESELRRDLERCSEQVALLERAARELKARLAASSPGETERIAHRLSVQEQTLEITTAYLTVLKRHLEDPAS